MKKGLITFLLMACPGLLAAYGCDDDKGGGDADTDVISDTPTDRDVTPDPTGDPDVTVDPDVVPDITPDIPDSIDLPPDSTGCTPLHGGVCGVIDNCGCDAGQICTFDLNPTDTCDIDEVCAPSSGTLATGADCDPASDQCAPGNTCLTNNLTGESKCYKWCDGDEDCEAGHSCNVNISFNMGTECPALTLLYKACDLGCAADAACDPFTGTGCSGTNNSCLYDFDCGQTFCAPSGAHAVGEDCADTGLCVIGAECLTTDGGVTNTCMAFCDDSHACESGTCTVFTPAYTAIPSLGACIAG